MITETRLARVADATGFTPWATGSPCRTRVPVHVSSAPPNRANTTPAKIAGPLSMACRAPFLPFASAPPGETDTRGRRTGEPGVNAEPTHTWTHPGPGPDRDPGLGPAGLHPRPQPLRSATQPYPMRSGPGSQVDSN